MCKSRHLLERHGLGRKMLSEVNGYLERHGLKIGPGTIVDATLLDAHSSTKNKSGARDPEMHQVKKGNQWYFGMKAHVDVDNETRLIHSVAATAANIYEQPRTDEINFRRGTAGMVLIGMSGIEKRIARFPQFYSCIGFFHEFRSLDADQVQKLLEQLWTPAGVTAS